MRFGVGWGRAQACGWGRAFRRAARVVRFGVRLGAVGLGVRLGFCFWFGHIFFFAMVLRGERNLGSSASPYGEAGAVVGSAAWC